MRPDGKPMRFLARLAALLTAFSLSTAAHAGFDDCQVDIRDLEWAMAIIEESACVPSGSCHPGQQARGIGFAVGQMTEAAKARGPEVRDCMGMIDMVFQQLADEKGMSIPYRNAFEYGVASKESLADNLALLLNEIEMLALAAVGAAPGGEGQRSEGQELDDAAALVGGWNLVDDNNHTGTIWVIDFASDGGFVTTHSNETWEGTWTLEDGLLVMRVGSDMLDWAFSFAGSDRTRFRISFEEEWHLFERRE